jgi:signal transduction histidine kinase
MADKEKQKELSRDIARMKRIVSQLLDIAELEAFTVGLDETADLNAVCGEVAAFVAPLAVAEAKQIIFDAPECPVPVRGNAEVIFRAVRNVAENAIRHTPEKTTVTITVAADGAVSVADQGPGIAPTERAQIFQRFWRKHRSGSTGAGLGLSIVKRIMDAHRGEIGISDPGEAGCVFTLKFRPARLATASAGPAGQDNRGRPPLQAPGEDATPV